MRGNGIRLALLFLLVVTGLLVSAACGGDDDAAAPADQATGAEGGGAPSGEPILIGISAARTGILAPYDLQSAQLFQMRIEEINAEGGVLGRPIEVEWIDTKSDQPLAASNAAELIGRGAVAIIATCDFDYAFPAIQAAGSQEVPGIALCASSPKVATPDIVGPYGGSMGLGSDGEGVAMAEWLRENRPEVQQAYIFKDTSLEYSKATADYFKARWLELGGKVCGEDSFVGGPELDLSSQITRLRGRVGGCDVIYDGSWNPFGAQLVRAIRDAGIDTLIATNASVNGTPVTDVAGRVSDFLALGFACLPTYCEGTQTEEVVTISKNFEAKYGEPIGNHYALPGYRLADVVVQAIETAGSTEGPAIADALFNSGAEFDYFGNTMTFTENCHRPQPAAYSVEEYQNGVGKQIDTVAVESIPDIGDGSPCSGTPPPVE
jgi:branched-chain amino acid transport system substrate-binding protein